MKFHFMNIQNYVLGNSIGRGSFGSVYYCVHKQIGREYAVKVLNRTALKRQVIFNSGSGIVDESESDD